MTTRFTSAKYDAETLTVDYVGEDGSHLLRTGGAISWRFNNPGNIRPASATKLIMGAIGIGTTKSNGSFLIFPSYEHGRAQKKSLLRRKFNDRTIYTMLAGIPDSKGNLVMGYAPKTDNNDPEAYAKFISDKTGFATSTKLSDLTDDQLEKVLDAMEIKEGFNDKKSTRKEKVIAATNVTVSDGSRPKPDVPVQVKVDGKATVQKTNETGQLPPILHLITGQKIEISFPTLDGGWKKQLEFVAGAASQAYVVLHDLLSFSGQADTKKATPPAPPSKGTADRKPIRYVVQAGDTLGKIAARYKTTAQALKEANPEIKDMAKIYVGQVIGIYGTAPALEAPKTAASGSGKPPTKEADVTRSKNGSGEPVAVVPADQSQAPWMECAIAEAKRFAGKKEGEITKSENYVDDIGVKGNLVNTPWCASFVNYCLKTSKTPYEASASSQFPGGSKKFVKIDKPVYGALMVMRNYVAETGKFAGSGHITFVYGQTANGHIAGLGGNQGDSVKLSPYAKSGVSASFKLNKTKMEQKFHAFYIPATYEEYAKKQGDLAVVDIIDVNKNLFKIEGAKPVANEGTR